MFRSGGFSYGSQTFSNPTFTGQITITAGTATTDVNALNITQTWNQGATIFTGIKAVFTVTAADATSKPIEIFGGAAGTTSLLSVNTLGSLTLANNIVASGDFSSSSNFLARANGGAFKVGSNGGFMFSSTTDGAGTLDGCLSRISAGVIGVGTGAAGSVAGSMSLTNLTTTATSSTGTAAIIDASNVLRPLTSSERFKNVTKRGWEAGEREAQAFLSLSGVVFDYREDGAKDVLGFSAEEVAATGLDALINIDGEGKPLSLREHAFLAYIHSILKSHDRRLQALEMKQH